jgi:hypothetical protein
VSAPAVFHWGEYVDKLRRKHGKSKRDFAQHFTIGDSAAQKLFKRSDWYSSEIQAASDLLGINLFSVMVNKDNPTSMAQEDIPAYSATLQNKELVECREKLKEAKEMIGVLKEFNSELKRRRGIGGDSNGGAGL